MRCRWRREPMHARATGSVPVESTRLTGRAASSYSRTRRGPHRTQDRKIYENSSAPPEGPCDRTKKVMIADWIGGYERRASSGARARYVIGTVRGLEALVPTQGIWVTLQVRTYPGRAIISPDSIVRSRKSAFMSRRFGARQPRHAVREARVEARVQTCTMRPSTLGLMAPPSCVSWS
jgi:hypothetical protein